MGKGYLVFFIALPLFLSVVQGALVEWDYTADGQHTDLTDYGNVKAIERQHYSKVYHQGAPYWWQGLHQDKVSPTQALYWPSPHQNFQSGFTANFGKVKKWAKAELGKADVYGRVRTFRLQASVDCKKYTVVNLEGTSVTTGRGTSSIQPSFTVDAHEHTFTWGDLAADSNWSNYVIFGQAFEAKCIRMEIGKWIPWHNSNVGWSKWRWFYDDSTTTVTTTITTTTATTNTVTTVTATSTTGTKTSTTTVTTTTLSNTQTTTTSTSSTSTTDTTKTSTTVPPSWYSRPTNGGAGVGGSGGALALQNDRLTIDPGNNRAVVIEGSLHVIGSITVDATPADGTGVTNLAQKLDRCTADQEVLQVDHAALQTQVRELAKRMAALELQVAQLH